MHPKKVFKFSFIYIEETTNNIDGIQAKEQFRRC